MITDKMENKDKRIEEQDLKIDEWIRKYFDQNERGNLRMFFTLAIEYGESLAKGRAVKAVEEDKDCGHGKCIERGCTKFATVDYNGHGHWVCKSCNDSLERYFEEEYK